MIPCLICGCDASLGWVKGFVPAPDSQKRALCPAHNTAKHRKELIAAWRASMNAAMETAASLAAYKVHQSAPRLLTLHFTAGGSLAVPCSSYTTTDHNALRVETPDGTVSFFPLQHIRRYELSPLQSPSL